MVDKKQVIHTAVNMESETITFFDGKITLGYLVVIIIIICVIGVVLIPFIGILKTGLIVGIAIILLIYFGLTCSDPDIDYTKYEGDKTEASIIESITVVSEGTAIESTNTFKYRVR